MKALYFDCSSGISGNMTLGALLEIVGDDNYLIDELKKLNVDGYKIEISQKVRNGITGKYVDVILDSDDEHNHACEHHHDEHEHVHCGHCHNDNTHTNEHNHEEEHKHDHTHHHHEHRNLDDVNKIIDNSTLSEEVKDLAKRIFMRAAL